jgi:hypothetical protein
MRMSFLGLFTFSAPYLPYVILGLELLMDHVRYPIKDGSNFLLCLSNEAWFPFMNSMVLCLTC